ncbi:NAD(P)/FAD-dependent oxidoreductase [bacterium]|nr:NAD(P)/FAD-dependent oxidoreductase [bacterium]
MLESEAIIVGAGPAGSTCAWKLRQMGIEVILLDKQMFPRLKPCAGWITPKVLKDLNITAQTYCHSLTYFDRLYFHFKGFKIPVPTKQFAIRRYELDNWLVQRSGVSLYQHQVNTIERQNGAYVLDGKFKCRYLVGAGGTGCRVYHELFKTANPRAKERMITTLEEEFQYPIYDHRCYLWYFDNGLPGYSWYVPKNGGFVNMGVGGKIMGLKRRKETIRFHWNLLTKKLENLGLIKNHSYNPKGHNYYLRSNVTTFRVDNSFLIGDAAGLATFDMGEGIGPAVQSGILAAESIVHNVPYSLKSIGKYSFVNLLFPGRNYLKN